MKKTIFAVLIVIAVLVSLSTRAFAVGSNYFVSPLGVDTNPGTVDKPWRTIQKAANTMVAGDTVTVVAGNYQERVVVSRSGEPDSPITFKTEGTVTTRGFTVNSNYVTVRGFEVTNTIDGWVSGWGIYVDGSYNVVENNYVYYATRGGIYIFADINDSLNTHHNTVRNNRLYRNGMAGLEVYGRNNLIENNEIWGTIQHHPDAANRGGLDADGMRFFGSGHVIRKNYIHDIKYGVLENTNPHIDCFQTFTDANHEVASYITIEQNICYNLQAQSTNETGQGFMMEGGANHLTIKNNIIEAYRILNIWNMDSVYIENNTFVGSLTLTTAYYPSGVQLNNTPNSVIKNNILYNLPTQNYVIDTASRVGLSAGYNDVYRSDGKTPSGAAFPNDLWNVNPQFVDPATHDYHLRVTSPLIGKGQMILDIINDFDSVERFGRNDIGAYQAITGVTPTVTLIIPPTSTRTPTRTVTPTLTSTSTPTSTFIPTLTPTLVFVDSVDNVSIGLQILGVYNARLVFVDHAIYAYTTLVRPLDSAGAYLMSLGWVYNGSAWVYRDR